MLSSDYAKQLYDSQDSRFRVKGMRRTTPTVILASRAAPPQAAGSQKFSYIEEHISTWKKSLHANFFFISAFNGLQIILLAPPWCKDSKNVIRFEIRPWEGGEKIGHTYKQTDRQTDFREF